MVIVCLLGCVNILCVGEGVIWYVIQSVSIEIICLHSQLLSAVVHSHPTFSVASVCIIAVLQVRMSRCLCLATGCSTVCQLISVIFLRDKARSCLYLLVSGSWLWVCAKVWLWVIWYVRLSLFFNSMCLFLSHCLPYLCLFPEKKENVFFMATQCCIGT